MPYDVRMPSKAIINFTLITAVALVWLLGHNSLALGDSLPPQGVFSQACPITTMLSDCDAQLASMKDTGFTIVVTSPPTGGTNSTTYLQSMVATGIQGMWQLDAPGWWGDNGSAAWGYDPNGTSMLSKYPTYHLLCGCSTNDELLQYIVGYLTADDATWGWYIADDSQFAAVGSQLYQEQIAGLTTFSARLKQLAPTTHTVIADCCNSGTSQLQNSYQVADFTAHELYPIFSYADTDPLTGEVAGQADYQDASAVQSLMDSYQKPSALILQAFDWGMDTHDAAATGDDATVDAYPTAEQQLAMRNGALLASDPQLVLWFYWNDTAGWPTGTMPASFQAPIDPADRLAGLKAAVTAPLPKSSASLSTSLSTIPVGQALTVNAQASVLGGVTSLNLDPGTGNYSLMPASTTTITFSAVGTYVLRLHAVGRLATVDATATVTVTLAPATEPIDGPPQVPIVQQPVISPPHIVQPPKQPSTLKSLERPVIQGKASVGNHLMASNGLWSSTGLISYSYQWQSCNKHGLRCQNIPLSLSVRA